MTLDMRNFYKPLSIYFRRKRLQMFYQMFEVKPSTKVLDVGGGATFWLLAEADGFPCPDVTIVNLDPPPADVDLPSHIHWVVADGTQLPFDDGTFDIAFSNSVIEHVGDHEAQVQFADQIRRVAAHYFVQTPSRDFPIEPHVLAPFIHWFPKEIQRLLLRNFTVWGLATRPSPEECEALLNELKLLNHKELHSFFPDSTIQIERFLGIPKSLLAIKG
jgi:SAM-dependent methyltransferase